MVPVDGDYPFALIAGVSVNELKGAATSKLAPGGRRRRIQNRRARTCYCV
jgi:hypothetical protein